MGPLEIARGLFALLFFQTSWSFQGRQGLGLKFVLLLTSRTREQRQRIMEHAKGALNTNPFAAGAVVGAIERAEYDVQELQTTNRFVTTAQRVLAAGGDLFFWQTLRPALTALAVMLGLFGSPFAPFAFLIAFNAVTMGTRAIGLRLGYQQGRECVPLLQGQFDRWTRSLTPFAAVVVGMILTRAVLGVHPLRLSAPMIATLPLVGLAWLALTRRVSPTWLLLISLLILAGVKLIL
jgi:mannose/fructose/N-acetylgalactosamine-specific phosphotransferase system component IID